MGRGGDVRGRTHTGLVAEKSPLDALHQRRADRASQRLLPAESVGDDQFQHFGQPPEVEQHDAQRQHDVPQRHNRDDHAADTRNAPYAAEDDEQRQRREHDAHPHTIGAESSLPRGADRVALHRVEGESEGHGDQHGEQHAHPPPPETAFHVVGRAADERVPAAAFVKLREGRLDESARGAHKGDDPHPEDRAGSPDDDGRGDAREIPRADAAGQRHGECLERRDVPLALRAASGRLAQHAHHLAQQAELHAPRAQGEPHGTPQERRDQHIGPQHVVHAADPTGKSLHQHTLHDPTAKLMLKRIFRRTFAGKMRRGTKKTPRLRRGVRRHRARRVYTPARSVTAFCNSPRPTSGPENSTAATGGSSVTTAFTPSRGFSACSTCIRQ